MYLGCSRDTYKPLDLLLYISSLIGDNCLIGPECGFYTVNHPMDSKTRVANYVYGKPITVGDNVWFGGHCVVLGGVTIGNNVVVGAGSVVTKDIPDNCLAVGNPCRAVREITESDKMDIPE